MSEQSATHEQRLAIWRAFVESHPRGWYVLAYLEGRTEAARSVILRLGRKKFGPPSSEQVVAVTAITDTARLEALGERLLDVSTWYELLKPG